MLEEILPGLYRIEIPLLRSPLKALNSYLIKGKSRSLLVDTGWNKEECLQAVSSALSQLDIDPKTLDLFLTHSHADHVGLARTIACNGSRIYFNRKEALVLNPDNSGKGWEAGYYDFYIQNGFPPAELEKAFHNHPGVRWGLRGHIDFSFVKDGDALEVGDYHFTCLETPGHSPGHMCLYEASKKLLLAGDHILFDITPNVAWWVEMENPLGDYLANLDRIYDLELDLVLPGHRARGDDYKKRIEELRWHHRNRLKEITTALEDGDEKNAFQIAPCISWDIDYSSWEQFPPSQKWFAVGETLAHLQYLQGEGLVRATKKNGQITYSLAAQ